jgi:hypothetical protein
MMIGNTQNKEGGIFNSDISKQSGLTIDILSVVINGLHTSGKLKDRVVIEQELKTKLPVVSGHDLNCYAMCIW